MSQQPDISIAWFNLIRSRSSARPLSVYYHDNGGFAACCHRSQHAMRTNYTHGGDATCERRSLPAARKENSAHHLMVPLLDWPAALRPEGAGLSESAGDGVGSRSKRE